MPRKPVKSLSQPSTSRLGASDQHYYNWMASQLESSSEPIFVHSDTVDKNHDAQSERNMLAWLRGVKMREMFDQKDTSEQNNIVFLSDSHHLKSERAMKREKHRHMDILKPATLRHDNAKLPPLIDRCYQNTHQPKVALSVQLPQLYLKDNKPCIAYDGPVADQSHRSQTLEKDHHRNGKRFSDTAPLHSHSRTFHPSMQVYSKSLSLYSQIKLSAECLKRHDRPVGFKYHSHQRSSETNNAAKLDTSATKNDEVQHLQLSSPTHQRATAKAPSPLSVQHTLSGTSIIQQATSSNHDNVQQLQLQGNKLGCSADVSITGETVVEAQKSPALQLPRNQDNYCFTAQVESDKSSKSLEHQLSVNKIRDAKGISVHDEAETSQESPKLPSYQLPVNDISFPDDPVGEAGSLHSSLASSPRSPSPALPAPGSWARANTQVHISMGQMDGTTLYN